MKQVLERKNTWLISMLGVLLLFFVTSAEVLSDEVLTNKIDLKGNDASITITSEGTALIKTKRDTYILQEDSQLYSSKSIQLTLSNDQPVTIKSIFIDGNFELQGTGTLNVLTNDPNAVVVRKDLRAFKSTKRGEGALIAHGAESGIRVGDEIQMEGGVVEGYGREFGIWCNNDIKPYRNAVLKGVSSEGIGIWAYRDIYAWKGATVTGEGLISGAYSQIAHIQAEDQGSSITGISRNLDSKNAALHAQKKNLRAYNGAIVREEYINSTFKLSIDNAINVLNYSSVKRNMNRMENYKWSSDPIGVYNNNGLLIDPTANFKQGTITGVRTAEDSSKNEPTQLKKKGQHQVIFRDSSAENTEQYMVTAYHTLLNLGSGETTRETRVHEMNEDDVFGVDDYSLVSELESEGYMVLSYSVDRENFNIVSGTTEYEVYYQYEIFKP